MENEIIAVNSRIRPVKRSSSFSVSVPERVQDVASPNSEGYLDPPPTYSRAAEDSKSSDGSTAENTPVRDSTTTSVVTMTTTTTTTTTSTTTSLKRAKSTVPARTASSGSTSNRRIRSKSIESFQSANDPYLDSLLARSVAALELSNALLESTLTTKSTLSSVLASEEELEKQHKRFEQRLLEEPEDKRAEWMQLMDSIVRDVDSLFDAEGNHAVGKAEGEPRRRTGLGGPSDDGSGLVLGDTEVAIRARSQPPRALTQYVIISGANARAPTFASEATADKNSIFLPSTTGLRNTAHKEAFRNTPSSSKQDSSYSRRESLTSVRANHSPMPSSGSGSFRVPPPPTHPEALPLSAQELLERRKEEARVAESSSASTREGLYEYLRGLHTHSATPSIASASSTVSKRSRSDVPSRPVLSPQQPRIPRSKDKPPSQTPSSPTRTSTPQSALMDNDNERHARSRSNTSASTLSSSVSSPHKYSLNSSTQLPLSFPTSIFRRSPSLRSPTPLSPTDSNTSLNSEAPFDWYSPSLAAIPDQHEDGEVGLDRQGTILASSAPLEGHLGHIVSRGRSPRISPGLSPGQGRAIVRGRFKTADTLRKLLDTSPSPHPSSSSVISQTSTIDQADTLKSSSGSRNATSRSNTDSSSKTISIKKSGSRKMSRDNTLPASIAYDLEQNGAGSPITSMNANMHVASSSSISSSISLLSPSGFSSTSDLPSTSSDLDRRRMNGGLAPHRPMPRFMPRTPSGMTAGISVSGATARAPKMRAHLVEDLESPVEVDSTSSPALRAGVGVGVGVEFGESDLGGGGESSTMITQAAAPRDSSERRRTKSLSASVSSMLDQARAVGGVKASAAAAATGRRTSGSKLKGSPAWHAERKLAMDSTVRVGSTISSPPPVPSPLASGHQVPTTPDAGAGMSSTPGSSNPGSKRTSWIGVPVGLLGLAGLTTTTGGGATASSNSSIYNGGTSTPPMRVSFAKEPVRYSVERDSMSFEEEEEEEETLEPEPVVGAKGDEEIDGGKTIRPTDGSLLRRSQSWDGSMRAATAKGKGKGRPSGLRRVPSRSHSKKKVDGGDGGGKKKEGWLDWFLGAMTAGPNGAVAGPFSSGTGGLIGREELFENRGRDEW